MLLCGSMAYAQKTDPVVMKINGEPISRSEFEYSYNKNNSEAFIVTLAYVLYTNWCNSTREKAKTKNNNN